MTVDEMRARGLLVWTDTYLVQEAIGRKVQRLDADEPLVLVSGSLPVSLGGGHRRRGHPLESSS